jgi:GTP-binding protein
MIERYLNSPRDLRAVFLLTDIRHEPNANDRQMYDWIVRSGHRPILIATKGDKIKRSRIQKQLKLILEGLNAPKGSKVFPFSALNGSGREEICGQIAALLQADP